MERKIRLPRTTADGKPRISYSQYKLWKDLNSFNLGVDGWKEYIVNYFLGFRFPDKGWGEFGRDVEDYVCTRKGKEKFKSLERKTLDKIKPLGTFQKEIEVDFGEFVLFGYIDDCKEDLSVIRDYKTASKSSKEKYYSSDFCQLDFYAMFAIQETGEIPDLEVVIIERKGNCMFSGGREKLSVGTNIWTNPIYTDLDRIEHLKEDLTSVVHEISDYYNLYLSLINKK